MSNLHAYADDCAVISTTLDLSGVVRGIVARVATATATLWPRDLSRYPDHLLADLGYERDWDGTIVRTVRD